MSQRHTFRDRVADLFRRKAGQWIHWSELAECGGAMAWRTRVSDCRLQLSMRIENEQRKVGDVTHSYYRYTPPLVLKQADLFGKDAA